MWRALKSLMERWQIRREHRRKGVVVAKPLIDLAGLAEVLDRSPAPGVFALIMVWAVSAVLLTLNGQHELSDSRHLIVEQDAPRTVVAKFDFTFPDYQQQEEEEKQLTEAHPDFFQVSSRETAAIRERFTSFFEQSAAAAAPTDPVRRIAGELYSHPDGAYAAFLRRLDELLYRGVIGRDDKGARKIGKLIRVIDGSNRQLAPKPVADLPDPEQAGLLLANAALTDYPVEANTAELRRSLAEQFTGLIGNRGNLVFNAAETAGEIAQAIKQLPVRTLTRHRGELLVRRGDSVTETTRRMMAEYARQEKARLTVDEEWSFLLRNLSWSLALVLFAAFYLYHLHPEVYRANKRIALVGLVVILSLLINYAAIRYYYFMVAESRNLPYDFVLNAVPVALGAVVLAVILGYRVALCAGFFIASITAMMLVPERALDQALKGMVLCAFAALAVRSATNYRSYFIRTIFSVGPLTLLLNLNLVKYDAGSLGDTLLYYSALVLATAFATGLLALVLIFIFEIVFNVSTNMALMVLCDYNHPLLERLKREAPGTFFHSLMVATLVEDAARAIGANPLKAKAGALFHDIGKLSMPQYFTENNIDSANQHLSLNPQMSSIIIRDHVKEGLALARQYRMCRTVRDAIVQHHGNDLVHFFYAKALAEKEKRGDGAPVLESQFRYAGTPPQDKEMAIISLADACEAACRALDKPSAAKIESVVNSIFLNRYQGGQLNQANITLAELDKVRQSFINTIISMKHGRIAYQREPEQHDKSEQLVGDAPSAPSESK